MDNPLNLIRPRRAAPSISQAQAEGSLILVVDDHATNRSVLVRQLNLLGYAVDTAVNGAQALERWQPGRYGLVLADCNMPVVDGYQLARSIREIEAQTGSKRTPVIACTANALRGEAASCLAAGMDDYLAKPVRLAELQAKVNQWLPLSEITLAAPTAGTGTEPAGESPVDRSVLALISGGDLRVEAEILRDFRCANDNDVTVLENAVNDSNLDQIVATAHRMQGASWTVGAAALGGACERLRGAGRARDWPAIQQSLTTLRREIGRLNIYIDAL